MTDDLSPQDRERLARVRFTIINAAKLSGVVLMLFGLWIALGDLARPGGRPAIGAPLFLLGVFESMMLPRILARRWRSGR